MPYELSLPIAPINYVCPEDYILESEKFKDGGKWFLEYGRFIARNFYNQQKPNLTTQNWNIWNRGIGDEAVENQSYVFGDQVNSTFFYETTDMNGVAIPAVWIPGQKITELFENLKGRIIEDISNIKIKSTNLSKYAADYKNKLLEKLNAAHDLKGLMSQVEGIKFDPTNEDQDFEGRDDILKYVEKWQDKYAIIAERLARNEIYMDRLDDKFCQSGTNVLIGGVTGMLTEVVNGRRVNTPIPTYELIWDNRVDDDYLTGARLCGYVKNNIPFTDILQTYKDKLSQRDIEDIYALSVSTTKNLTEFMGAYNSCPNLTWFTNVGTNQMTLTLSKQWFIAPRDWRWKESKNSFGQERFRRINEDKYYQTEEGRLEGANMAGDFWGWDVYYVEILGNRWLLDYGYMDNVIRPYGQKEFPQLPMRTFCLGMEMGYGKPMVSRLKKHQNEIDRLEFKVQQLTARDLGLNHIFNGNRLDEDLITLLSNFKTKGVHVSKGTSGEANDPNDQQPIVEQVDMRLDPNISKYIELQEVQKREMESICSVSQIALGQQQNTIGKGVQEATINQNSYGTASLFYGLMKHYEKILQYNVNLTQLVYTAQDSVEETLQIGDEGAYLLKIMDTQEFGSQHLGVFIEIEDALDQQSKERIRTLALSAAQNDKLDLIDYLEFIELGDSKAEMVEGLKYSAKKKKQEQMQMAQAQQQGETQSQMALQDQNAQLQVALKQFTEENANYRNNVNAETKVLTAKMDKIMELMQLVAQQQPVPLEQQLAGGGGQQQPGVSSPQPAEAPAIATASPDQGVPIQQ